MRETLAAGLDNLKARQWQLGNGVRALLAGKGFASVAASEFASPGVVVCYTSNDRIHNGKAFIDCGLQSAAGVPLMCDEPASFKTFRIGLFGLDKLADVEGSIQRLANALDQIN
jgi:aspartate aminotransferase-like enzyme